MLSRLIILPAHDLKIQRKSWAKIAGENEEAGKTLSEKVKDGLQGQAEDAKRKKGFPTI